jgi:pilus assembly protein CpaF
MDLVGRMIRERQAQEAAETGVSPYDAVLEAARDRAMAALTPAQLENPGPEDREALRRIAGEEVQRYNEAAAARGHARLDEPVETVVERIINEILGLGLLELLLRDESIEDAYILGPHRVIVVRADGRREPLEMDFGDERRLWNLAQRAVEKDGKRVDFSRPFADARLPDGSRFHVCIYPCAEPWPQIVIRRHRHLFAEGEDRLARLIEKGTLTPHAALLLRTAVRAGVSILVTGATAAGKTTFIDALGGELDPWAAVVCIEDTRELSFPGENVSYLTTRLPSVEGEGAITQRFLVQQSLRKRPDWVVLGEARGGEAWDFAQAGNTGHSVMGSVHANSARDAVERYRDLCLEASENLGEAVVLRGVVRAFHLVVYIELDAQLGRRVVKQITEVTGRVEGGVPTLQDLFLWQKGELRFQETGPFPRLRDQLAKTGGWEAVARGEGISAAWIQEAQRWARG